MDGAFDIPQMSNIEIKPNPPNTLLSTSLILSLAPGAVFLVIALTLIILDHNKGRAYFDHTHFHLPVIEGLIENFDISDYKAATAPGYHLIFAGIGQISGLNVTLFKLINALITAILIGYLSLKLSANFRPLQVLLLMLPLVLSVYIFPAGVWLLPDNLAWLAVAWLTFQINNNPFTNRQLIGIAIVLALAVFVRQTYLWLAAIVWASGLSNMLNVSGSLTVNMHELKAPAKIYLLKCLLATLPAIAVLAYLATIWQGLVPPSFQGIHHHLSPSAPAFFFALFAVYTTFYIPVIYRQISNNINKRYLLIGATIGFISVIFVSSSYDIKAGRFGGLWNIIKIAPTFTDKSLLMIILSTLGGAMYAALMQMIGNKERLVMIIATIAFISAMMVNQFVYERYFSGFIYIVLIALMSKQTVVRDNNNLKLNYWLYSGVVTFALLNASILYLGLNQSY